MDPLVMVEHQALPGIGLTQEQVSALQGSGALNVIAQADGTWTLRAGSSVGIVQAPGIEVRIHPKVPVGRLLFLLGYSADAAGWRETEAQLARAEDFLEGLAHAFAHHAERAIRFGVLQGYVEREESLPALRGRLVEGNQLRAHFGLPVPVEVRYDDFSTDIDENRMLAGACRVLLRFQALGRNRGHLRHLLATLGEVAPVQPGVSIPTIRFSRLNERYRAAILLSRLILEGSSARFSVGAVSATALLVDMNKVFEDFVCRALGSELKRRRMPVRAQHGTFLDVEGRLQIRPDLTSWRGSTCLVVLDAKYKDLRGAGPPPGDIYQMLSYCTAHGLDRGHLIYASRHERPQRYRVRNSGITIEVHALDLDHPPEALLAKVAELARSIARSAGVAA